MPALLYPFSNAVSMISKPIASLLTLSDTVGVDFEQERTINKNCTKNNKQIDGGRGENLNNVPKQIITFRVVVVVVVVIVVE